MDLADYLQERKQECDSLKTIEDLKLRIDMTYKSMERYRRLRDKNWIVNNQPFAEIIRDALNEIDRGNER